MRLLFAGTGKIAVPTLEFLAGKYDVAAVLTNPDAPVSRSGKPVPSAVGSAAEKLGIPTYKFEHLKTAEREAIGALKADLMVVFAYGHIFGPKFLSLFPKGSINVHPSLLPELRGAAPIQFAILNRLEETGISVQRLALEMDAGDILKSVRLSLDGSETTESLTEKVASLAPAIVSEVIDNYDSLQAAPQSGEATYTHMIKAEESLIDWNEDASVIGAKVRAFTPWPRAKTFWKGKELIVSAVSSFVYDDVYGEPGKVEIYDKKRGFGIRTGNGLLYVSRLQLATKKEMDSASFKNGNADFAGSKLGERK